MSAAAADSAVEELGVDLEAAAAAFRSLQSREAWRSHGTWITGAQPAFGPGIAERFATASRLTDDDVGRAVEVRSAVVHLVADATAGGRLLLGPAAAGAAPRLDLPPPDRAALRWRTRQLTCLAGLAGAPVVVLPLARQDGLPLGLACVGQPGSDLALLRWAVQQMRA